MYPTLKNIAERDSLYNNTVFEPNGTRETIPLKMFCSPTEDERSLEASDIILGHFRERISVQ
jgi:hypothetical protein